MVEIIYRDERLVAVHKPARLLTHRTALDRGETRFALQQCRDLVGRQVYPVHRLDKGTSGVLLFALDRDTASVLGRAFENRAVRKTYLAVVRGYPAPSGEIDHPLSCPPDESPAGNAGAPVPALTRYRTLATAELPFGVDRYPTCRYALLELEPVTGRRHQLRRHMKHIAHPVIGDSTHGKGAHNRAFAAHTGVGRLLLACVGLELTHPASGRILDLQAALEGDFASVVRQLGWAAALPERWLADDEPASTERMTCHAPNSPSQVSRR